MTFPPVTASSIRSGSGAGTEGAVLAARVEELKFQVLTAVGFDGVRGGGRLIRS